MPDWASPSGPSPWWQKLQPRALTMAISPRCSTPRAIAATSLSRADECRGDPWWSPRSRRPVGPASGRPLLQAQRNEAKLPVGIRDQKEHRPAAFLLELLDPLLQRVRIADRLLRDLDHHVARTEPLVGGGGL